MNTDQSANFQGHQDSSSAEFKLDVEESTPLEQPELHLGSIGSYQLLSRLGEGGMGEVFKAVHTGLGRVVALKRIRSTHLQKASSIRRFLKEVRAMARVDHPYIVRAYDANNDGDMHYLVMEYIEGTDLLSLVAHHGPMRVDEVLRVAMEVGLALQHLHINGLVHRDVKPSNLIRDDKTGIVKLMDLGLARVLPITIHDSPAKSMTLRGTILGTPDYMAPEQVINAKRADIRSDLYSLGCTLYFLLTGSVPFPCQNTMQKLMKQLEDTPEPLLSLRPGLPPEIVRLVEGLMAKAPEKRPQSPTEMLAQLQAFTDKSSDKELGDPHDEPNKPAVPTERNTNFWQQQFRDWVRQNSTLVEAGLNSSQSMELILKKGKHLKILLSILGIVVSLLLILLLWRGLPIGQRIVEVSSKNPSQRADLILAYRNGLGSKESIQAAKQLRELPSPLDALPLSSSGIPSLRLGDPRGRQYSPIWALAAANDGKTTVSGGPDGGLNIWNTASHSLKSTLRSFNAPVHAVAISSDGKIVAGAFAPSEDGVGFGGNETGASVWNLSTNSEVMKLDGRPIGKFCSLAISPNQKYMAAGHPNRATLWNLETNQHILDFLVAGMESCEAIEFSPDSTRVYTGEKYKAQIRIWNVENGRLERTIPTKRDELKKLVPAADGYRLLEIGSRSARIWDTRRGELIREFSLDNREIQTACWAADEREIIVGCTDGYLAWISTQNGKTSRYVSLEETKINELVLVASTNMILVGGSEGGVRMFQSSNATESNPLQNLLPIFSIAFTDDDRQLSMISERGKAKLYNLPSGELRKPPSLERFSPIAASPNGMHIFGIFENRKTGIYSVSNQKIETIDFPVLPKAKHAVYLPMRRALLYTTESDNKLHLSSMNKPNEEIALEIDDLLTTLSASMSETRAVFGTKSGKFVAVNLDNLSVIFNKQLGFNQIKQTVLSPEGDIAFASVSQLGVMKIDLIANESIGLRGFSGEFQTLAISPDGQTLAVTTQSNEITLVSLPDEARVRAIKAPGIPKSIVFSIDSSTIAVAYYNGLVELFRLTGRK